MTTPKGAAAQLQRLLTLVPYVLDRRGMSVSQVATDFGVSEAQVVRDLRTVLFCGLPGLYPGDMIEVDMEAVRGGRVEVTNADFIKRPLRLQVDEALALLVALRALGEVPGLEHSDAVASTLIKLRAAAGDLAFADAPIEVEVGLVADPSVIGAVRDAIEGQRRLHLTYHVPHRDETTERDVDPMRLLFVGERAYLEGWCRRAEDVRLFRLDRVTAIDVLDVALELPADAEPRDLDDELFRAAPEHLRVTIELDQAAAWITEELPLESVDERPDKTMVVTLRTADTRWLTRLVLRLGGQARVLDPPELDEEIRALARKAFAAYDASPTEATLRPDDER